MSFFFAKPKENTPRPVRNCLLEKRPPRHVDPDAQPAHTPPPPPPQSPPAPVPFEWKPPFSYRPKPRLSIDERKALEEEERRINRLELREHYAREAERHRAEREAARPAMEAERARVLRILAESTLRDRGGEWGDMRIYSDGKIYIYEGDTSWDFERAARRQPSVDSSRPRGQLAIDPKLVSSNTANTRVHLPTSHLQDILLLRFVPAGAAGPTIHPIPQENSSNWVDLHCGGRNKEFDYVGSEFANLGHPDRTNGDILFVDSKLGTLARPSVGSSASREVGSRACRGPELPISDGGKINLDHCLTHVRHFRTDRFLSLHSSDIFLLVQKTRAPPASSSRAKLGRGRAVKK
ncbi:hypothetical protein DFH06DRAFT_1139001 [Mycena polygramma]|nr:hypothetical protein DFH06DRAFT_1139001 [Mycena polygramma]